MFTAAFARDAIERAVRTFAQSLLATLALATGLFDASWGESLSVAGLAALLSVLTSVVASGVANHGDASLVSTGRHARTE